MTIKVDIKRAGIRRLLKEPGVAADLARRARSVAAAAGPGHGVRTDTGRNRVRAAVVTESFPAMRKEATARNLTRAVDAAR